MYEARSMVEGSSSRNIIFKIAKKGSDTVREVHRTGINTSEISEVPTMYFSA